MVSLNSNRNPKTVWDLLVLKIPYICAGNWTLVLGSLTIDESSRQLDRGRNSALLFAGINQRLCLLSSSGHNFPHRSCRLGNSVTTWGYSLCPMPIEGTFQHSQTCLQEQTPLDKYFQVVIKNIPFLANRICSVTFNQAVLVIIFFEAASCKCLLS